MFFNSEGQTVIMIHDRDVRDAFQLCRTETLKLWITISVRKKKKLKRPKTAKTEFERKMMAKNKFTPELHPASHRSSKKARSQKKPAIQPPPIDVQPASVDSGPPESHIFPQKLVSAQTAKVPRPKPEIVVPADPPVFHPELPTPPTPVDTVPAMSPAPDSQNSDSASRPKVARVRSKAKIAKSFSHLSSPDPPAVPLPPIEIRPSKTKPRSGTGNVRALAAKIAPEVASQPIPGPHVDRQEKASVSRKSRQKYQTAPRKKLQRVDVTERRKSDSDHPKKPLPETLPAPKRQAPQRISVHDAFSKPTKSTVCVHSH